MSAAEISAGAPGRCAISGELTFATVPDLWRSGAAEFGDGALRVDLAGVTRVDSAGIALLVEMLRAARRRGAAVFFERAPPQLLVLAAVGGLETLLPFVREGDLAGERRP